MITLRRVRVPAALAACVLAATVAAMHIDSAPVHTDAASLLPADKRSGVEYQSGDTRAMQRDPGANPGLLWVSQGAELWDAAPGDERACAGCHGEARKSMRGVAARYPAIDGMTGTLLNLEGRINTCRTRHQHAAPFAYESDELLALSAFAARQSAGMPVMVSIDGAANAWFERGREFYARRQGQLNLACRHCHQLNAGRMLRGEHVSQGHGNGYPAYRLEWQTLGSLHRRFKSCSSGVRATMYDYGSDEYLALELLLAWCANGLPVETPAVRR